MNNIQKASNIIKEMVKNPEHFLDEDVLKLLIEKYTIKNLLEQSQYIAQIKNRTLYGNLASILIYENLYSIKNINIDTRLVRINPAMPESEAKNISFWLNIFNLKEDKVFEDISFEIEQKQKDKTIRIPVSLLGLIAITDFNKFVQIKEKNPQLQLTKNDIILTAQTLLINKDDAVYSFYDKNLFKEATNFIASNWEDIKSFESINDEKLFSKIIKSALSKNRDTDVNYDCFSEFVNDEVIHTILKHCSLKTNIKENPSQFSSMQSIAKPERWIQSIYNKKGEHVIFSMNSSILEIACGYGLNQIMGATGQFLKLSPLNNSQKSFSASKEIIKRLNYFGEEFKKQELSESEKILWYTAVIYTGNTELFLKSLSIIPYPKMTKQSELLFEVYMAKKPEHKYLDNDFEDYYDAIKYYNKNLLEQSLVDKQQVLKKIKI